MIQGTNNIDTFLIESSNNDKFVGLRLAEEVTTNTSLRAEVEMLNKYMTELKGLNTCLRDEHTALMLAFASLEGKLRKVQVMTFINIY